MAAVVQRLYANYRYAFDEMSDPRTSQWFMVGSIAPVFAVVGAYLYFVLSLGPRLMRNRKPFNLDKLMIVYNAIQVACSLHVVREAIICCYSGQYNLFCEPVNFSDTDEDAIRVARGFWFYYMLKYADLLDTIFFVLRKKSRQISFLHVYHHTGMVFIGYLSTKFLPGGHGAFVGLANCLVHAVLYTHYLVAILNPEAGRHGWWKKHITQMQMVQFGLISWHWLQLLFQPSCGYPRFTIGIIVPQNLFLCLLFYDFYRKTYTKGWDKSGGGSGAEDTANQRAAVENASSAQSVDSSSSSSSGSSNNGNSNNGNSSTSPPKRPPPSSNGQPPVQHRTVG